MPLEELTQQDRAFIQTLKSQGFSKEETFNALVKVKSQMSVPKEMPVATGKPFDTASLYQNPEVQAAAIKAGVPAYETSAPSQSMASVEYSPTTKRTAFKEAQGREEKAQLRKQLIGPTVAEKTIEGVKEGAEKIGTGVSDIATLEKDKFMQGLNDIGKLLTGQEVDIIKPGVEVAQDVEKLAGGVSDILGGGMQATFAAPGAIAEEIPGAKQVLGKVGKANESIADNFTKNLGQDPNSEEGQRTKQAVHNFLNLVELHLGKKVTESAPVKGAVKTGGEVLQKVKTTTAPILEKIDTKIGDVGVKMAKEVRKETLKGKLADIQKAEDIAGQIAQADPAQKVAIAKSLSDLPKEAAKDYKSLKKALDEKAKNLREGLDKKLEAKKDVKKLADLTVETKVGDKTINHNYVEDAIKQLESHYRAVNDPIALEKIIQKKLKAENEGLTVKEINDIAREHGGAIKTFSSTGQAPSGLSKQAAENTRSGVKETGRNMFGDAAYKIADEAMTEVIKTRDLITKMEKAVNKLQQKIQQRSLGQKAGRLIAGIANTVSGGALKGGLEYFIGRGAGLKTLNALDLQEMLSKNLSKLQNALKENASKSEIIKELESLEF